MSKRTLPVLKAPALPEGVTVDVHPRARAAWAPVLAAEGDAVINIFGDIGDMGWGESVTPTMIAAALNEIGDRPVTVQINSPGGIMFDGLAIYNLLREHPEIVTVKVLGIAASAASLIAMAGDQIQMAKSSLMMIHNTQWIAAGDRHVMAEVADIMATFDDVLVGLYADRTGLPASDIAAMMDAETFLSAKEADELGFATALIEDASKGEAKNRAPVLQRLDTILAKGEPLTRSERRKLIKEIVEDTPRAGLDPATPGAGDLAVEDDGSTGLSIALARLKLARA